MRGGTSAPDTTLAAVPARAPGARAAAASGDRAPGACGVLPRLRDGPARGRPSPKAWGPVQFGRRLEALVAYLRYAQHLPVGRLRDLLRELHGVVLSTGTVKALCRRAAARLAPETEDRWWEALSMPVACMDETWLRVTGERVWLHVIYDERTTLYRGPAAPSGRSHRHGRARPPSILPGVAEGADPPHRLQRPPAASP